MNNFSKIGIELSNNLFILFVGQPTTFELQYYVYKQHQFIGIIKGQSASTYVIKNLFYFTIQRWVRLDKDRDKHSNYLPKQKILFRLVLSSTSVAFILQNGLKLSVSIQAYESLTTHLQSGT